MAKATAKKAVKKTKAHEKVARAVKRVEAIPKNQPQLVPFFSVKNAHQVLDFYKQVFGAKEIGKMLAPDGVTLAHVSLRIGNSVLMLAEAMGPVGDQKLGQNGGVYLYVKDTDAIFAKAAQLGAKVVMPPQDMFWGDRMALFVDPAGNLWQVATHIEDVKPAEMARRTEAMMSQASAAPLPSHDAVTTETPFAQA